MKVTKAQAQENRARIVEVAAALFRERGYEGVGVAELMAAAGFTHGGFYKHFKSKADLMAEAAAFGLTQTASESDGQAAILEFIERYLSREHRDNRSEGCTFAALCGDAARQPDEIKATFAKELENRLTAALARQSDATEAERQQARAGLITLFTQAMGAVMLSRAMPDDSPLADEILQVCREALLVRVTQ